MGKTVRMNKFIDLMTKKSVIIKADWGMRIGKELIDVEEMIQTFKDHCDGIVLDPEQTKNLFHHFLGKRAPALIIRTEWANVFQAVSLPPPYKVNSLSASLVKNAITLGASAIISFFFVGYERDEDEAKNLESISFLARECEKFGFPMIAECIPFGERITKENFSNCVELAARVSTEAGADVAAIPYTGDPVSFRKIVNGVGTPVLMLDIATPFGSGVKNIEAALNSGASGIIVGEETFKKLDFLKIKNLYKIVHKKDLI